MQEMKNLKTLMKNTQNNIVVTNYFSDFTDLFLYYFAVIHHFMPSEIVVAVF